MRIVPFAAAVMLALATAAFGAPAAATDVAFGSVQFGAASPTQLGRLSRNGIQQDWTGGEPFPGIINPAVSYAYTAIALPFGPNALNTVYYEISFDDAASDLFASAYLDAYNPGNLALNWLGDAGSSGNFFAGDPLFFDVVVPAGHSLVLVVNRASGGGTSSLANYFISGFADTEYTDFAAPAVPEPTSWALLILGFGMIGGVLRHQRQVRATA